MKSSLIIGIVAVALCTGIANASIITVPTDLPNGAQYRFVFMTSTSRDATSTNIADYNALVDNTAKSGSSLLKSIDTTWMAIASTSTVVAIDNTNTPTSVTDIPIYLVDGNKVADDYADLWDGNIDHAINCTELDSHSTYGVWTGSTMGGSILGESRALGDPTPGLATPRTRTMGGSSPQQRTSPTRNICTASRACLSCPSRQRLHCSPWAGLCRATGGVKVRNGDAADIGY